MMSARCSFEDAENKCMHSLHLRTGHLANALGARTGCVLELGDTCKEQSVGRPKRTRGAHTTWAKLAKD